MYGVRLMTAKNFFFLWRNRTKKINIFVWIKSGDFTVVFNWNTHVPDFFCHQTTQFSHPCEAFVWRWLSSQFYFFYLEKSDSCQLPLKSHWKQLRLDHTAGWAADWYPRFLWGPYVWYLSNLRWCQMFHSLRVTLLYCQTKLKVNCKESCVEKKTSRKGIQHNQIFNLSFLTGWFLSLNYSYSRRSTLFFLDWVGRFWKLF